MDSHVNQPIGASSVEPPLVVLATAFGKGLQGSKQDGATFRIEHAANPQHPALAGGQAQHPRLRRLRLPRRVTLGIDRVPAAVTGVAEATDAGLLRLVEEL